MSDETDLEKVASSLFDRRDELNQLLDRCRKERDHLNDSVKDLQLKAAEQKNERDRINRNVAEIKVRIESLHQRLDEKIKSIEGLDEELQESRRRLRSRRRLENELHKIEWELSTTPTLEMREKEALLIEQSKEIRLELEKHTKLDSQDTGFFHSFADSKAVELEIRKSRDEMKALRDASQEHHERMLVLYQKADEERKRSDKTHEKFVECLNEIKEVNGELDKVMVELRKKRKDQMDTERRSAMRRSRLLEEKKIELVERAQRKLEAGEKLTIEEMKLIYGEYQ